MSLFDWFGIIVGVLGGISMGVSFLIAFGYALEVEEEERARRG